MRIRFFFLLILAVFLVMACPVDTTIDDTTDDPVTDPEPDPDPDPITVVYVAGYYNNGTTDVACYWVDGVRQLPDLTDGTNNARAHSIFVSGSDIYVAGYYSDGTNDIACYWKNGLNIADLSPAGGTHNGYANSIFVSGGVVYTAGYYKTSDNATHTAAYWTNSAETILNSSSQFNEAKSIYVRNGTVYVTGLYNDGLVPLVATYWVDGVKQPDLYTLNYSRGLGIFVTAGGDVYISGDYYNSSSNYASCYWKNNAAGIVPLFDDTIGSDGSEAASIVVSGGTVYSTGFYENGTAEIACYWTGGVKTDLTEGSPDKARGKSIQVVSGTVYVAGYIFYTGGNRIACVWKNGVKTDLYDSGISTINAEGLSIFVEIQ